MKQGEIDYLKRLGTEGVDHAFNKPFSDSYCGIYLVDIGRILWHLTAAGTRVLDLGVGTGWTSIFMAKAGHRVTGVDISPDMIALAEKNKRLYGVENVEFRVSDYENLPFENEFDGVVFYDALHHAMDERRALEAAHRALKPGGLCITLEPGEGHAAFGPSREAVERFSVTEKDMPPARIMELGEEVGFAVRQLVAYGYAGRHLRPGRGFLKRWGGKLKTCVEILKNPDAFRTESRQRNMVLLRKGAGREGSSRPGPPASAPAAC